MLYDSSLQTHCLKQKLTFIFEKASLQFPASFIILSSSIARAVFSTINSWLVIFTSAKGYPWEYRGKFIDGVITKVLRGSITSSHLE
ncbi:MAG: hypothetical protein V7K28_10745 [Nostoc sp.]